MLMTATTRSERDQRAINKRNKPESSLISNSGRYVKKKAVRSRKRKFVDGMAKFHVARAASVDANKKQCALEEELFGGPVRDAPPTTFIERPFGHPVAFDELHYKTCGNTTEYLTAIVVSIALFDGNTMLFACSGIPLLWGINRVQLTRFVTSARLVTAYNDNRNLDDQLRIEVRHSDWYRCVTPALLGLYDDRIAIVTALGCPPIYPVKEDLEASEVALQPAVDGENVRAAGRACTSHSLMSMCGYVSLQDGCKCIFGAGDAIINTEAALGGPLIGLDGRFLGMIYDNYCEANATCVYFIPRVDLCERLDHFQILNREKVDFRGFSLPSGVLSVVPSGFRKAFHRIRGLGYPLPPPLVLELRGELCNTFEEKFGEYRAWKGYFDGIKPPYSVEFGVWKLLQAKVVSDISHRVVSLKSFNGYVRSFVCTGLFIKWHGSRGTRSVILTSASLVRNGDVVDIHNSWRIEVFLPPKQRASGILEFYNSDYNIAIVSVDKTFRGICPEDIFSKVQEPSQEVIAIGRKPDGLLMATCGEVKHTKMGGKLDCRSLKLSTCKIKKVGIGGPLIDLGGNLVGMNFYDGRKETPFLPRSNIINVLGRKTGVSLPSERGLTHAEEIKVRCQNNRWPVPEPYWRCVTLEAEDCPLPLLRGRTLQ